MVALGYFAFHALGERGADLYRDAGLSFPFRAVHFYGNRIYHQWGGTERKLDRSRAANTVSLPQILLSRTILPHRKLPALVADILQRAAADPSCRRASPDRVRRGPYLADAGEDRGAALVEAGASACGPSRRSNGNEGTRERAIIEAAAYVGGSFRNGSGYSDLKLVTGLASAALTECQATVSIAMQKVDAIASPNISQLMGIRYWKVLQPPMHGPACNGCGDDEGEQQEPAELPSEQP